MQRTFTITDVFRGFSFCWWQLSIIQEVGAIYLKHAEWHMHSTDLVFLLFSLWEPQFHFAMPVKHFDFTYF
jgi:hypothetical protein